VSARIEDVLDRLGDADVLEAADPDAMLRAVASSAAQVREAVTLSSEAGLARLADEGRPRAVVVLGMGGSGVAGDVLAAAAGPACPVPVVTHRGYDLPAWVGAADLVVAVSCSGTTEETLASLDVAIRRSCRLLAVGAADSPLHERARQARGLFVPVPGGRQPRASMWALSTPLVVAAAHLRLLPRDEPAIADVLEATAARLQSLAERCRPDSDAVVNPAKSLALALQETLPAVWGTSPLAGTAAYRFACQLAENAKLPALSGVLPEANHNAVMAFEGRAGAAAEDLFRDRLEGPAGPLPLRLVLLRDAPGAEHPRTALRAEASKELAAERGVGVQEVVADGASGFERLAELVGLTDYASVYLAVLAGVDPTPVSAIEDLKRRIAD
jgi:glucose/mannose-6-phosphate isomerase